jgi:hypothetical protein
MAVGKGVINSKKIWLSTTCLQDPHLQKKKEKRREEKNSLKEFTENLEKDRESKFSWKERKRLIKGEKIRMLQRG